jgi:hypothetical protein
MDLNEKNILEDEKKQENESKKTGSWFLRFIPIVTALIVLRITEHYFFGDNMPEWAYLLGFAVVYIIAQYLISKAADVYKRK